MEAKECNNCGKNFYTAEQANELGCKCEKTSCPFRSPKLIPETGPELVEQLAKTIKALKVKTQLATKIDREKLVSLVAFVLDEEEKFNCGKSMGVKFYRPSALAYVNAYLAANGVQ